MAANAARIDSHGPGDPKVGIDFVLVVGNGHPRGVCESASFVVETYAVRNAREIRQERHERRAIQDHSRVESVLPEASGETEVCLGVIAARRTQLLHVQRRVDVRIVC